MLGADRPVLPPLLPCTKWGLKLRSSTDGGLQSFGHCGTPGIFKPIEAVRQLRGEVPDLCPGWERGEHTYEKGVCRKVRDPKTAFVATMGPPTGGGFFCILARD